ncbi:DNA glycosylase AlkZ-like family protein [Prevotella aurantiaca]
MQALDYRMMSWAVAMRTTNPSGKMFKKAFDDGEIIRLHLMRGTWQIVLSDDYWWLLEQCAPKAISVIKGWMNSNKVVIYYEEALSVREIIALTASDKGSLTKDYIVKALLDKVFYLITNV